MGEHDLTSQPPPPRREGYTALPPRPEAVRRRLSPEAEDYLDMVLPRLEYEQYVIAWGEHDFDCVAKLSRFEWSKFGFVDYTIVFAEFGRLDSRTLWDFSQAAFEYAAASRGMSMPGLQGGKFCFPVAMIGADEGAVEAVIGTAAPKHYAKVEFPCVFGLRESKLYFFQGTPLWGAFYYAGLRSLASRLLGLDDRAEMFYQAPHELRIKKNGPRETRP
jgi:hypothetical protein